MVSLLLPLNIIHNLSSVSVVNFEHVIASWESYSYEAKPLPIYVLGRKLR